MLPVAVMLTLAGCGGAADVVFVPPADEGYPAEQVDAGQEVYSRLCATCHGSGGQGRTGPNIVMVWERFTFDEQRALVAGGRRQMPGFELTLTPEELDAVIAYTRTGWPVGE